MQFENLTGRMIERLAQALRQWFTGQTETALIQFGDRVVGSALEQITPRIDNLQDGLAASTGASLVGFQQSGTGAVARTLQDKAREVVTPYDFGAVGDGVADDTAALEKWRDHVVDPADQRVFYCAGRFKISSPLVFDFVNTGNNNAYKTINWNCVFISNITTLADVLTFKSCFWLSFCGSLTVIGYGNQSYSSRKNRSGVRITDCSRFNFEKIVVRTMLAHGLHIDGTSSQPHGSRLSAWECGSSISGSVQKWESTVATVGARSGSSGSTSQKQAVTLSANMPDVVDSVGWFIKIGGRLHKIVNITSPTSIEVFPWLDDAVTTGSQAILNGGAGYYSIGGDSSCGRIESLDSLVCGVGHHSLSIYPTSVGNLVSQYSGITCVIGSNISSAFDGLDIGYLYSEADAYGLVKATLYESSIRIGATVTFPKDRSFTMGPAYTGVGLIKLFSSLGRGVSISTPSGPISGSGIPAYGTYADEKNVLTGGNAANVEIGRYVLYSNSPIIDLADPTATNTVSGQNSVEVVVFGGGANRQATGTITVRPQATHTINGGAAGASITYSGLSAPTRIIARWAGGNWVVSRWDACVADLSGSKTYDWPDLATATQQTTTVTVTGAALGDYAEASMSVDLAGTALRAYVSAADTVTVVQRNDTGANVNLASGTLRVRVRKP